MTKNFRKRGKGDKFDVVFLSVLALAYALSTLATAAGSKQSATTFVVYVLGAVVAVTAFTLVVATLRHAPDSDERVAANMALDVAFTLFFAANIWLDVQSHRSLTWDVIFVVAGLLSIFGPGGRGRRDAVSRALGEKSRSLIAKLSVGPVKVTDAKAGS